MAVYNRVTPQWWRSQAVTQTPLQSWTSYAPLHLFMTQSYCNECQKYLTICNRNWRNWRFVCASKIFMLRPPSIFHEHQKLLHTLSSIHFCSAITTTFHQTSPNNGCNSLCAPKSPSIAERSRILGSTIDTLDPT